MTSPDFEGNDTTLRKGINDGNDGDDQEPRPIRVPHGRTPGERAKHDADWRPASAASKDKVSPPRSAKNKLTKSTSDIVELG